MDKRQGRVSRFSVENFCLTMPKFSLGESFTVALNCGNEKVWIGGGVSRFSVKNLVPQYRKTSPKNPSVFQKTSGIEIC